MEILDCLNKSKLVKSYEVLDFKTFENGFYIKIKAVESLSKKNIEFLSEYDGHPDVGKLINESYQIVII